MNQKHLVRVAKAEIQEWKGLPSGLVMVILWAFIHRVTTGETVEETFFKKSEQPIDYEI